MHALGESALGGLAVPALDPRPMVEEVRAVLPKLDRKDRAAVDELVAAWEHSTLSGRSESPVLLHGDFHFGNMVFGGLTGPVIGIWDFTCVEFGDPAADLRYLAGDSSILAEEVAGAYTALTGRPVDIWAARMMLALEDITDASAGHRPVREAIDRWHRSGLR